MAERTAKTPAVRALQAASVLGLIVFGAYLIVHDAAAGPVDLFDRFLYCALIAAAAALCLARAALVRQERIAWIFLGANLVSWALAEIYWAALIGDDPNAPYPSPADVLYLISYPISFVGIALLVKARAKRFRSITLLDGAVAALTAAAFGAAFLLTKVIDALEGPALADAVTLAYPISDTLLFGFLLSVLVLLGWRLDRSWIMIVASLAILVLADGIYSYQEATGTYAEGGAIDFMFPLSAILLGLAAWAPSKRAGAIAVRGWRSLATPAAFAMAAVVLVAWGYFEGLDPVAVPFTWAALLLAMARLGFTYRDNQRLFERAQADGLTGLSNRSALMMDLQDELSESGGDGEAVLAMFDLNGFKLYNDSFGHPAGDALLTRLSRRFAAAVEAHGKAYRIGGDEFCALLECHRDQIQELVSRASAALSERGEAFEVGAARGFVILGEEAADPEQALQVADRRMYQDKAGSRSSARTQAHEVLMRVLRERQPELGAHVDGVTELAGPVARRMGIDGEDLEVISRAAALHDIGKLAIPDAVLEKPSPLEPEEWQFIRDHTLVGERILREAPALLPVAQLVRSSHERWDGDGYPDGLEGELIPLGSRIIFVCDAFQAMVSTRPYSAAVTEEEAVAELERCAGSQFDPMAVEAFLAVLEARPIPAPTGKEPKPLV